MYLGVQVLFQVNHDMSIRRFHHFYHIRYIDPAATNWTTQAMTSTDKKAWEKATPEDCNDDGIFSVKVQPPLDKSRTNIRYVVLKLGANKIHKLCTCVSFSLPIPHLMHYIVKT